MGVSPGSPVSAANTNAHFIDSDVDDTGVGKYTFANSDPASGSTITNVQAAVNANTLATGASESNFATGVDYTGAPASTIITGQTHKQSLVTLAQKFDPILGHTHKGTSGDGPQVSVLDLAGVQLIAYAVSGTTLTGVTGGSTDLSAVSPFPTASPSNNQLLKGVVVNVPENYVSIFDANDDHYLDGTGNKVYARITNSGGVGGTWTLTYYSDIAGTETAYTFSGSNTVKFIYQQIYDEIDRPVYSNLLVRSSDQIAGTIPAATQSLFGKVELSSSAGTNIASSGAIGTANGVVANSDHEHKGVYSVGIDGDATKLFGAVDLEAGSGIALTRTGQKIKIDGSTTTVGFQEVPAGLVTGSNPTFGPLSYTPIDSNSLIVFIDFIAAPQSGWSLVGTSIVFNVGSIPQVGQSVYVFYLINGTPPPAPPAPSGTEYVEYHTVTLGEETSKSFNLSATPSNVSKVMADIIGGGPQQFTVDFTVAGSTFSWMGLGLDGILATGDVVRLHYFS